MNQEQMEALLKANLSGSEMRVLLALKCGHLDIYGIQIATGYQRQRAVKALNKMFNNAKALGFNKNNKILRSAAQNVYSLPTPPETLLAYLADTLGLPISALTRADHAGVKQAYLFAYEWAQRDSDRALQLVHDCITVQVPRWRNVKHFGPYLLSCLKAYLRDLPPQPLNVYEAQLADGKRRFYNNTTNHWEIDYAGRGDRGGGRAPDLRQAQTRGGSGAGGG